MTIEQLSNKRSFLEESRDLQKSRRSLYIPDKQWELIKEIADRSGVSKSKVVREIFDNIETEDKFK